ncbi:hypothetical protein BDV33DRAFT_167051 [Aspergillus novoparasiticus]|uniref:Transcription factor domain-containing protein n=1 Tax=Aspergillus novoparasiticus TaxID=986946 RepID=A0A5N6F3Z1_9EURO|nr:hypothetical protein BDV33DRAFT_167051 [Aspergillus novoparasiticus]
MPFTTVPDKWDLQQHFARDFRAAFLKAQTVSSNDSTARLDDLEALALMANFEYEKTDSPPLHSNLGGLFLRHESLVMMMLQYRVQDRVFTGPSSSVMLSRARERRVLLHWHVYGLDAFHCLDRKQISLIPDTDPRDEDSFSQHGARDFLDAVLGLAVIARKLLLQLCSNAAKRHGIEPNDVHDGYARISQWRNSTCPTHLRRCERSPEIVATSDNNTGHSAELQRHIHLHRAVLWALEINCLMQIESFVSDFGLRDNGSLLAEVTTARIEYESLRALNDMVAICRWIDEHPICEEDGKQRSLVDLAPLALRNVCAGLCLWTCQRSISSQFPSMRASFGRRLMPTDGQKHPSQAQLESARLLRETAAKATSHRDTVGVLERLDKQIALLDS